MKLPPPCENLPLSRLGKKQIGGYFAPGVNWQLKIAAARENKIIEQILEDTINEYFERRGILPIAGLERSKFP